jgi:hypothetical protein
MFAFAIFYTVLFVLAARYLAGFRKSNQASVTAYLGSTKTDKKVFIGHPFSGKWHNHWTLCVYTYHVNGKSYTIKAGRPGTKADIPKKVTSIFQRTAPKNAFIQEFTSAPSPWGLLFILLGCILFYAVGLDLWLF